MNRSSWNRVRRDCRCPICGKSDWCLVASDRSAVICGRVESDKPVGGKGAGWLHKLTDNDWKRPTWQTVPKPTERVSAVDFEALHERCRHSFALSSRGWLSNKLGISVDSLEAFQIGFNAERNVFAFPMRNASGAIVGMRYRTHNGKKFSETGGREGMFFVPENVVRDHLIIVEGASDAMAMFDLGFPSVIGRSNCTGNIQQLTTVCRRLQPKRLIIIPDNDSPGISGAEALRLVLTPIIQAELINLPTGIKDIRVCIQEQKNADWLRIRIGGLVNCNPSLHGVANNEQVD